MNIKKVLYLSLTLMTVSSLFFNSSSLKTAHHLQLTADQLGLPADPLQNENFGLRTISDEEFLLATGLLEPAPIDSFLLKGDPFLFSESVLAAPPLLPTASLKRKAFDHKLEDENDATADKDQDSGITSAVNKALKTVYPSHCSCGEKFSNNALYQKHMQEKHPGQRPMYKCSECPNIYSAKRTLTAHLKTHTGEKLFACDICKKEFSQKYSLKRHMLIHSAEKPFECCYCEKRFSDCSNRNAHEKNPQIHPKNPQIHPKNPLIDPKQIKSQ